jgi:flavorubredoxin
MVREVREATMSTISEVGTDIFRVNLELEPDFDVSCFVIRDEAPTLIETGFRKAYQDTYDAVRRVIDPAGLRYIVVPHWEGDEAGALEPFLGQAPHALPVGSPIGAMTNLSDVSDREPLVLDEGDELDLGEHRLRALITPYVHTWDSMLAYEEATGTLFASDVFATPTMGGRAVSDGDDSDAMIGFYRTVGIFPSREHLDAALDKIEALEPTALACHHGSVKGGEPLPYLRTMREQDVTGVTYWNPMRE